MELADVLDSKSSGSDTVRVRPPPPAPEKRQVSTETCRFFNEVAPLGLMKNEDACANEEIKMKKWEKTGDFTSLGRSPSSFCFINK